MTIEEKNKEIREAMADIEQYSGTVWYLREKNIYRLERELQIIRLNIRAAFEPAPRWFRWVIAKLWPAIFA